jgi:hypothetical protein
LQRATRLVVPESKQSTAADQRSDKGNDHQENDPDWCDLAAQESMANSTVWLKIAAWVSIGLSVPGLLLLGYTLRSTVESNRIATHTAQRQLRAYLTIDSVDMVDRKVRVIVKNTGQTPAYGVGFARDVEQINLGSKVIRGAMRPQTPPKAVVGRDGTLTVETSAIGILGTPDRPICASGIFRYTDAFGEARTTHYCFIAPDLGNRRMSPYEHGDNSAD